MSTTRVKLVQPGVVRGSPTVLSAVVSPGPGNVTVSPSAASIIITGYAPTVTGSIGSIIHVPSDYSTIQAAVDVAVAGDRVRVADGEYAGFQLNTSGSPGSPITIEAVGSAAIIDDDCPTGDGIRYQNVSYVTVDGLEVKNSVNRCIAARGATASSPMYGNIIKNCVLHGSSYGGMYLSQFYGGLVQDVHIYDITGSHGLYLANAGSKNTTLRRVVVHGVTTEGKEGIHVNGDVNVGGDGVCSGILVDACVLWDIAHNGMSLDGVKDSTFQNNLAFDTGHGIRGYQIDGAQGPENLVFINNAFHVDGWAIKCSDDEGGHTAFNNILLGGDGALCVGNTNVKSNHNIVVNSFSVNEESSTLTLAQWQSAISEDADSAIAAAADVFVTLGSDYQLKTGTNPAVDVGAASFNDVDAPTEDILGETRPSGGGFDCGPYERIESAVLTPAAASVVVTGHAPTIAAVGSVIVTPAASTISVSGAVPVVATSDTWTPDYYLSPTIGSDGANGLTQSTPWATFAYAQTQMSAGESLGLLDGTYTESFATIKSGSAGNPLTVRAMSNGGAIIDGEWARKPVVVSHDYWDFEGMTGRRGSEYGISVTGDHNNIRRLGMQSVTNYAYAQLFHVGGTGNLFEDCFGWGCTRSGFEIASAGNTFRRCVVRLDALIDVSSWESYGFRFYNQNAAIASVLDNCMVIDSEIVKDFSGYYISAFRIKAYQGASDATDFYGCISLNNKCVSQNDWYGWAMEGSYHTLTNCLAWDGEGAAFRNWGTGMVMGSITGTNVTGAVGWSTFENTGSNYINWTDEKRTSSGLTYPCRPDGEGDGCTIEKRYEDGVLTGDDLWPWPHQNRIRSEMRGTAYTASGYRTAASPTRGFCATDETLTHYVWNQLGNGSPY